MSPGLVSDVTKMQNGLENGFANGLEETYLKSSFDHRNSLWRPEATSEQDFKPILSPVISRDTIYLGFVVWLTAATAYLHCYR